MEVSPQVMMTTKQIFLPMSPTTSPVLINHTNDTTLTSQSHTPNDELPFDHAEPLFAEPFWALPIPTWEPLALEKSAQFPPKGSTELMTGEIFKSLKEERQESHLQSYNGFQSFTKQPLLVDAFTLAKEDWSAKSLSHYRSGDSSEQLGIPNTSLHGSSCNLDQSCTRTCQIMSHHHPRIAGQQPQVCVTENSNQGFQPIRLNKSDPLGAASRLYKPPFVQGSPVVKVQHTEKAMPWLQASNSFVASVFTNQKRIGPTEPEMRCPYCHKTFERIHNLRSHLKSHSSEKPFVCDICSISFRRNHDLTRHKRAHTGLKPYACKDCGKTFSRSFSLNRHYTRQTSGCTPPEGFNEGSCVSE